MCSLLRVVFLVSSLWVIAESNMDKPPIIKTKFGLIAGKWTTSARNLPIANFLGIPYAEPPVDELRFRSPKRWIHSWTEIRNATKDATPCVQLTLSGEIFGHEDCLYLNVFVPEITDKRFSNYKQPVLVFIHGGSFNTGSSLSSIFSPFYWADQQVILVAMNYRLGPLGFFSLGNKVAPGNYGLKDMVLALKWVQENIEDFGGDPELVTLMGQSAGAGAAHVLALSEKTKGLFNKYIIHSGSALATWASHPKESIRQSSVDLAKRIGCPIKNSKMWNDCLSLEKRNDYCDQRVMDCMRKVDVHSILKRVPEQYLWIQNPYCIFGPTLEDDSIEDAILSIPPMQIIKKHLFRDMPAIIGVVRDEGLLKTYELYRHSNVQKLMIDNFETFLPTFLESQEFITNVSELATAIEDFYFDGNITYNFMNNVTQMAGDGLITWPTYKAVKYLSQVTETGIYFFRFCYQPQIPVTYNWGISHADELHYFFLYNYFEMPSENSIDDWTLINVMTEMWASFMRTGVPRAWRTAEWPDYRDHREFMRFGAGTELNIGVESDFLPDRMEFWESLMGNVSRETSDLDLTIKPEEENSIVSKSYNSRVASLFFCISMTVLTICRPHP